MLIVSFALGSLIGEAINLEAAIEDPANGSSARLAARAITSYQRFCLGFTHRVSAPWPLWGQSRTACSATVHTRPEGCTGLHHCLHHDGLAGRGCIFSALPVAVFRGRSRVCGRALPIMTTAALDSLSHSWDPCSSSVGVNLIRPQTFRTANMLPAVVIAVIYALLF
ncbi:MAG: DUF554 family protein [Collinsella sp.]